MSENLQRRIPEMITIWFTILIIQSRRAISPGPREIAPSHIKKTGTSSVALFAFIKFTANHCSKSDSQTKDPCQKIHRCPDQLRRPLYLRPNRCRLIHHPYLRWEDKQ